MTPEISNCSNSSLVGCLKYTSQLLLVPLNPLARKRPLSALLLTTPNLFKLPDSNPDLLDIAMIKSYVSSMKQEYISYWQNTFQHSQKLEFYRSFKTDHASSSYLDLKRGTAGRRALVKVRISNHKLMIEIGRYNQTTKDNRHCPFCGCNVIEDEVHFLFQCPTYSMIRNKFYYKVKTLIPNIT